MPCGRDKVEADVDPRVVVVKEGAPDLQLLLQVVFKLRVDVVDYGPVTTDSSVTQEASTEPWGEGLPTSLPSVGTSGFCLGVPVWGQVADPVS